MLDIYHYTKELGWIRSGKTREIKLYLDLIESTSKYGLGFNHDDLIVNQFTNSKTINSKYYAGLTLSVRNPLKNILSY